MGYSEEFLKKVVQVGTLGYPLSKAISVLDVEDVNSFIKDFYNESSDIYMSYKKGLDKADFLLDSKLFELAKQGDLKALSKYQIRKNYNQQLYLKELKNKRS